MDIGNAGFGAGGSLVGAFLAWAGFKQRLDRADADIKALGEKVVYKDTCGVCHAATLRAVEDVSKKIDTLIERMR